MLDQFGGGNISRIPTPGYGNFWAIEQSLHVQWAHAIAPKANIILIETLSDSWADLATGINSAPNLPGVSVISMSFGGEESSTDPEDNSLFTTPLYHQGISFVASTGDDGTPGCFPAYSPNVIAVGGTTLNLSPQSETGWGGSGGGQSLYEAEPAYQNGVQNSGKRQILMSRSSAIPRRA